MLTWSWGLFCFSCCPSSELSGVPKEMGGDAAGTAVSNCTMPHHAQQQSVGRGLPALLLLWDWLKFNRLAVDEQLWDFCIICGGFVLFFFEEFCFSFYATPFSLLSCLYLNPWIIALLPFQFSPHPSGGWAVSQRLCGTWTGIRPWHKPSKMNWSYQNEVLKSLADCLLNVLN